MNESPYVRATLVAIFAAICAGVSAAMAAGGAPALTGTWTPIPNPNVGSPSGPSGRTWTEMTWDSVRQEVVIFGGIGPEQYDNDIWSFNPTTSAWTMIAPYAFCPGNDGWTGPNGTDDTAFRYDPVNNLYWVFGADSGYRCISSAPVRTAGGGSGSSVIVDTALPSTVNNFYVDFTVLFNGAEAIVQSYSASQKKLTLATPLPGMGPGQSYQLVATSTQGVWYYDPVGHTWVGQDTPAGNTGPTPTLARIAPGVAYSDAARAFLLFAGWSAGADKQVWKLDVTTKAWTQLPLPATATPPHMVELLNSFVYDKANDVFVLFGGTCSYDDVCPNYSINPDTWVYRLSTNQWQKMSPVNPPPARTKHLMAYDPEFGVVVLFGGNLANGDIANDTWYYHYPSNTWTRIAPSVSPEPRLLSQIAYDPVGKRSIVFGGTGTAGDTLTDMWALKLGTGSGNASPTVALSSPSPGSTFAVPANIGVAATASDPDGSIAKVQFYAGTTLIGEDASSPYGVTWNIGVPGAYSLTAVAIDNLGASTTSAPVAVTVTDATPPSVSVTAPAAGATVSGTINVSASATDNIGVAGVQFLLDGAPLGTEDTASPYAISWNTTTAGNGVHTLSARARDAAGNQTTSPGVSVTVSNSVDTVPPTVTSTSPANGATGVNKTTSITATFSEAIAPATVSTSTIILRDKTNAIVPAAVTYTASSRKATLKPNASLASRATYTVTVKGGATDPRVKDTAGNALAADYVWSFTTK